LSYNAAKYQKPKASKHNQKCTLTPDKVRYRDPKEAQRALSMFRTRRKKDIARKGQSRYLHDSYYLCDGCNGYHLTKQVPGQGPHARAIHFELAS
jgi:hypothetical protein